MWKFWNFGVPKKHLSTPRGGKNWNFKNLLVPFRDTPKIHIWAKFHANWTKTVASSVLTELQNDILWRGSGKRTGELTYLRTHFITNTFWCLGSKVNASKCQWDSTCLYLASTSFFWSLGWISFRSYFMVFHILTLSEIVHHYFEACLVL